MGLEIRIVSDRNELESIFRFRYAIYKDELGVRLPDDAHAQEWLRDDHDACAHHYAVLDDGRVVGGLRVFDLGDVVDHPSLAARYDLASALASFRPDEICFAGRLALDRRFRSGTTLVKLLSVAYADLLARGVRLVYADCSPHLLPLYESLGFRRCAKPFNDESYGFKCPIVLIARDAEGLRAVRSPLARVIAGRKDDVAARSWFAAHYAHHLVTQSAALLPEGAFLDLLARRLGEDPSHQVSLLRGLSREEMNALLRRSTLIRAERGDHVILSGLNENALFFIVSGAVEVVEGKAPQRPISTLRRGDVFGEIEFLTGGARSATVVVRECSELVVITGEFLQHLVDSNVPLAAKMAMNLARTVASRLLSTTTRTRARSAGARRHRGRSPHRLMA
jgi:CRP-like cAMP-binding protein/predicted GNAT family N-acyltransferase